MNNINEYKDYIYALQMEIDNYQLKNQDSIANKEKVSNDNSIIFEDLLGFFIYFRKWISSWSKILIFVRT